MIGTFPLQSSSHRALAVTSLSATYMWFRGVRARVQAREWGQVSAELEVLLPFTKLLHRASAQGNHCPACWTIGRCLDMSVHQSRDLHRRNAARLLSCRL